MNLDLDRQTELLASRPEAPSPGALWIWNGYSLAERDRRWAAVRNRAQQAGLDCVFVPLGNAADARYLTQLSHAAVVLPSDGRPPIVIAEQPQRNAWVSARYAVDSWVGPMAEALLDAGMERARIGVAGLSPGIITFSRAPDGVASYALAAVERRLPDATFVDATDLVGLVRWIKSDEEVACLRRAVAVAEAGMDEITEIARPGVDGDYLFAAAVGRMLELGCEDPGLPLAIGPVGDSGRRVVNPPVGRRLQPDDYIAVEVNAMWGAQGTQEEQHFVLGPIPDRFKAAEELLREVFDATSALIKPGRTVGELIEYTNAYADQHGGKGGLATRSMLKGGGYGEDGPRISPTTRVTDLPAHLRDLRFEPGAVIVWKPDVFSDDMGTALSWGGAMRVTDQGAQFLGQRPLRLISIQ